MNTVSVWQAVLSDLDALVPLFDSYRRFYGRAGDPLAAKSFLRDRFEHGESVLFIASQGTEAVGFVQLYPSFRRSPWPEPLYSTICSSTPDIAEWELPNAC